MDSGNSGSLQSSSPGEDDYDFTGPTAGATTSIHAPPPQRPPPPPSSSSTSLFDTFTYFESFPRSPPPTTTSTTNHLLNLEHSWPRPLRPPFNPNSTTDITGLITIPSSSSSSTPVQPLQPDPPPRVSKKRSRASRRAPTTVLTTDTSNFRAMVQEFTGIPTAPFSSSTTTTTTTSLSRLPRYGHDAPYLLRPFAHKPQATTFFSSSASLLDHPNAATSTATVNSSNNQLSHDHLGAVSVQNQVFNFQSLLQSPITNLSSFMTNKSDQVNYGGGGATHNVVGGQVGGNLSNLVGSSEGMHSACSDFHSEKTSDGSRPPRTQGEAIDPNKPKVYMTSFSKLPTCSL